MNEFTVKATELKQRVGETLDRVESGEIVLVERHDRTTGKRESPKIVAVILSYDKYKKLLEGQSD